MKEKTTISLVLGSGGARGYTHIGVIEELLKQNYEIKALSGASMGALIGGLYACGKLQDYKEWILTLDALDVVKLLDFSFKGSGIISGEKVFKVIEELVGDVLIEELPIAYTAVATDIVKQKEVWLQKGRLIDAIRASIAIPTIFTPKEMEEMILVDGGVLNPLPIAPTLSSVTDLTVAVNLNASVEKHYTITIPKQQMEKEHKIKKLFFEFSQKAELFFKKETKETKNFGMLGIVGTTIDIMQNAILDAKIAGYRPDIMIDIPNKLCGFYEFHRGFEMIEYGRSIAVESLKEYNYRTKN